MKKLLSIMLALTLVCSCAFAFAETTPVVAPEAAPVKTGLQGTAAITLNAEQIANLLPILTGAAADEAVMTIVNAAASLLQKAEFGFRMQDDGGKLVATIGGVDVLNATLTMKDDKILAASSILPSYTLDLTTAAQQVIGQVEQLVNYISENSEAITALSQTLMTEYMAGITSMFGETQAVEIASGDITYVSATPISMTAGESGAYYVKMLDILLADEFVKNLIATFQIPTEGLETIRAGFEKLAALKGTENDYMLVSGVLYMTEDQADILVDMTGAVESGSTTDAEGTVTKQYMYMHYIVAVATEGGNAQMDMNAVMATALPEENDWDKLDPSNVLANIDFTFTAAENTFAGSMVAAVQGMQIGYDMNTAYDMTQGLNVDSTEGIYFMDMSAPLLTVTSNTKMVPAEIIEIAEGATVLDVATLDDEGKAALMADVQTNGLSLLMQNLYAAAPDEMMVIINALTPAPTTETPAEAPVEAAPVTP